MSDIDTGEKKCQSCKIDTAIPGERFCKPCKKVMLDKMKDDGYFAQDQGRAQVNEYRGRKARGIGFLGESCEMLDDGDDLGPP